MNLKKLLVGAVLAASSLAIVAESIARPMGGGRSIGRQSQSVKQMPAQNTQAPAARPATPAAAPTPPAAVPPKPASPWKGILGGALLGLGLGALLSHFGLGGAFASMLGTMLMVALLAGAAFFIYRMVRNRGNRAAGGARPAPAAFGGFGGNPVPQGAGSTPEIGSGIPPQAYQQQPASSGLNLNKPAAAPAAHTPWGVPADFDSYSFLRHAKSNFIRLQAAWDKADVNDIREFTTPEVFAELKMQIQERGAQAEYTDVVQIDADLLGIENTGSDYLASVKFTGMIKPAPDALAEPFNEVWNLSKPVTGNAGWLLAGIQQIA